MQKESVIIMFCVNCGKELKDTARFCPFCGNKIETAAAEIKQPAPVEEPVVKETPKVSDTPVQTMPEAAQLPDPTPAVIDSPVVETLNEAPVETAKPKPEIISEPEPQTAAEPEKPVKPVKEKKIKESVPSKPKKSGKAAIIAAAAVAAAGVAVAVPFYILPSMEYAKAETAMSEGRYEEAHEIFSGLDFKDSQTVRVYDASYAIAVEKMNAGDYTGAQEIFYSMPDFSDSREMYKQSGFLLADRQIANGEYKQALSTVRSLQSYGGTEEKYKECLFAYADSLAESGDYKGALELTDGTDITGYEDKPVLYRIGAAETYFNSGRYSEAASTLEPIADKEIEGTPVSEFLNKYAYYKIVDKIEKGKADADDARALVERPYMDSSLKLMQLCYNLGEKSFKNKNYAEAAAMFRNAGGYNGAANQLSESLFLLAADRTSAEDHSTARNIYASLASYKNSRALKNDAAAQTDAGHSGWYVDCASYLDTFSTLTFKAGDTITVKGVAGNENASAEPSTFVVIIRMPGAPAATVNCPDITSGSAIEASAEIPAEASGKGEIRIMLASTGHTLSRFEFKVD